MASSPRVLVVHCVDTEGPLGGNARRLPDGSPEFLDSWDEILGSLAELTNDESRRANADSTGAPYRFNWFILDFTGFRTNPKNRVARQHDTLDGIGGLPVALDGLYWHYHAPPASGIGDQWAASWLESNEHNTILARRLLERHRFPEAFRAGGTIEDESASRWLEEVFLLDFSNRVSERSRPDAPLTHFDWHGAPARWGPYHPAIGDVRSEGGMRRFVYRSLDLRSRYNDVTEDTVEECFRAAAADGRPRVLSFFSHDNRDMRPETYAIIEVLRVVSERTGVPWESCTAVDAHQRFHGLDPVVPRVTLEIEGERLRIRCSPEPFQRVPFLAARATDGRVLRLLPRRVATGTYDLAVDLALLERVAAGVTCFSGIAATAIADVLRNPLRLVPAQPPQV
jgi:hypothetical protein